MQLTLPFEVVTLAHRLTEAGFEAYLVGGAVRDMLLASWRTGQDNQPLITDYDLTTNATPEEIQALFPENFYENQFGTVSITHAEWLAQLSAAGYSLPAETMQTRLDQIAAQTPAKPRFIDLANATKLHASLRPVVAKDDQSTPTPGTAQIVHPFEITTYRSEGLYTDHRRPTEVTWGKTITEDLARRDFTINAIALAFKPAWLKTACALTTQPLPTSWTVTEADFTLVDPYGGLKDLATPVITTVGPPDDRFQEDALRMLRAIRFSVQLDMPIAPETLAAIQRQAQLLRHISGERIRDEFLKMLASPQPDIAIELLEQTDLLAEFLPEILEARGVGQGGHHTTDVWVHSLDALAACPSPDPIVRLATLLHDVGKPATYQVQNGQITAYNHEIVGSRLVSNIGRRLRLSKRELERLFILVRHHMFYYQPDHTDASIRRFMRNVGLENIDDILDLREADRLGSGARKTSWRLEEFKDRMIEQLHQPLDVTDLAVNGDDLMRELGLKPGPILGKLLHALFEMVMEEPELNSKEELIKRARELQKNIT